MQINKLLVLVSTCVAVVLGLGGGLVIWPAYRQTHAINMRIVDLRTKALDLSAQTMEIERLSDELAALRRRSSTELKSVPDSPDVASLIRRLSLPVDHTTVTDQEFAAGQPSAAVQGEEGGMQAMPVTIEMTATFETVFALLQSVESMERLVRVMSFRAGCKRGPDSMTDVTQLAASMGLEAIYEPAGQEEGK